MLHSGDLDFSFSGLKTAVLTRVRKGLATEQDRADLAWALQAAIVDVLVAKSLAALQRCGLHRLVVAGGVSANQRLRERLAAGGPKGSAKVPAKPPATGSAKATSNGPPVRVYFPEPALCTDNGAMIAFAGALRLQAMAVLPPVPRGFAVRPRWPLEQLPAA